MDKRNMERDLIDALRARGWRMAAAESCTGGRIAQRITAVPGASDVFSGSMVSYSCETKQSALGVGAETLKKYGAVSEETAREMASGVLRITEADVAVSVTGIAGPGGGTPAKPVGLVYISVASEKGSYVTENHFSGNREEIRLQTVEKALFLLYEAVKAL